MSMSEMPVKPVITSAANQSYQAKIDRLAELAGAGDWDAIIAYDVNGKNTYARMVARYRDALLAAAGHEPSAGPIKSVGEQLGDQLWGYIEDQAATVGLKVNRDDGTAVYEPRSIKRSRSTKDSVEGRRDSLFEIVKAMKPMTVRQVFYQATVHGLVEKTERGYGKVKSDLGLMRKAGVMPYNWLADSTRWMRKPDTFNSVEQALQDTARFYRKALWHEADAYVEIWLEKDALSGVVSPITYAYDVPLMVARGYASLSFLHGAAEAIRHLKVPAYIYHLGDFDPSGVNAGEAIERTLREMAPDAEIHFERIAVNAQQILDWNLPTRPTKASDTRSKGFGDISVELDAIEPHRLRDLVQATIERHMPPDQFAALKVAEESERQLIAGWVEQIGEASAP
jgi:hypothetical protein